MTALRFSGIRKLEQKKNIFEAARGLCKIVQPAFDMANTQKARKAEIKRKMNATLLSCADNDKNFETRYRRAYLKMRTQGHKMDSKRRELRAAYKDRSRLLKGQAVFRRDADSKRVQRDNMLNRLLNNNKATPAKKKVTAKPEKQIVLNQKASDHFTTHASFTDNDKLELMLEQAGHSVDNYMHRLKMIQKLLFPSLDTPKSNDDKSEQRREFLLQFLKEHLKKKGVISHSKIREFASAVRRGRPLPFAQLVFKHCTTTLAALTLMCEKKMITRNTLMNALSAMSSVIQCNRTIALSYQKSLANGEKSLSTKKDGKNDKVKCTVANNASMQLIAALRRRLQLLQQKQKRNQVRQTLGKQGLRADANTKNASKMPIKAKKNYVSMAEIKKHQKSLLNEVIKEIGLQALGLQEAKTPTQKQTNERSLSNKFMLFSVLTHLPPKRADYGNVRILFERSFFAKFYSRWFGQKKISKGLDAEHVSISQFAKQLARKNKTSKSSLEEPLRKHILGKVSALKTLATAKKCIVKDAKDAFDVETLKKVVGGAHNFVFLSGSTGKTSFMRFTRYKTAQRYAEFVEKIPPGLHLAIALSLMLKPRTHLILNSRSEDSGFLNNNSYTQFVLRAFEKELGRRVGCTMLRHIFVTEKIDPSYRNARAQRSMAERMMHTHQQQHEYRWVGCESK